MGPWAGPPTPAKSVCPKPVPIEADDEVRPKGGLVTACQCKVFGLVFAVMFKEIQLCRSANAAHCVVGWYYTVCG